MQIGFLTIKQADDILKYYPSKGKWTPQPSYAKITGTVGQLNASTDVTGEGTLFTSQLSPLDWLVIDENLVQVSSITDDLNLTLFEPITTSGTAQPEKLSSVEADDYARLLTEKVTYLQYAYDKILYSRFYFLPDAAERTDEEFYILQKAQAFLSAYYLNNPNPNRHLHNQSLGIVSEQIGDTSVDYASGTRPDNTNEFPQDVKDILGLFEHKNRTLRIHRRGAEQNLTEVYYPRGAGWTF